MYPLGVLACWRLRQRFGGPHCSTRAGINRSVVVPSPSSPLPLAPQQYPTPSAVTPQVWAVPAVTALKLTPAGVSTSTGLDWGVVVPSPSWPLPMPQQRQAGPAGGTPRAPDPPAVNAAKL